MMRPRTSRSLLSAMAATASHVLFCRSALPTSMVMRPRDVPSAVMSKNTTANQMTKLHVRYWQHVGDDGRRVLQPIRVTFTAQPVLIWPPMEILHSHAVSA